MNHAISPEAYRQLRERLGSQDEVAEMLGVTRITISKREGGKTKITLESVFAIVSCAVMRGQLEAILSGGAGNITIATQSAPAQAPVATQPAPPAIDGGEMAKADAFKVLGLDPSLTYTRKQVNAAGRLAHKKVSPALNPEHGNAQREVFVKAAWEAALAFTEQPPE